MCCGNCWSRDDLLWKLLVTWRSDVEIAGLSGCWIWHAERQWKGWRDNRFSRLYLSFDKISTTRQLLIPPHEPLHTVGLLYIFATHRQCEFKTCPWLLHITRCTNRTPGLNHGLFTLNTRSRSPTTLRETGAGCNTLQLIAVF